MKNKKLVMVMWVSVSFILIFIAMAYMNNKKGNKFINEVISGDVRKDSMQEKKLIVKEVRDVNLPLEWGEILSFYNINDDHISLYVVDRKPYGESLYKADVYDVVMKGNKISRTPILNSVEIIYADISGRLIYKKGSNLYLYENKQEKPIKMLKELSEILDEGHLGIVYFNDRLYWGDAKFMRVDKVYSYDINEDKLNRMDINEDKIIVQAHPIEEGVGIYEGNATLGQQFRSKVGIIDMTKGTAEEIIDVGGYFKLDVINKDKVMIDKVVEKGTEVVILDLKSKLQKELMKFEERIDYYLCPTKDKIAYFIKDKNSEDINLFIAKIKDDTIVEKHNIGTFKAISYPSIMWSEDGNSFMVTLRNEQNKEIENKVFQVGTVNN
ncbi:hypothetical protein [Desnuesiella massiliensis]|uniref:hypothetical protein n=1 Tax=Desnuesiella massiliensis TaxID=1650662 RepID=UPI0006E3C0A9|nr:hypothetical protein [Desnuesiella massiliensis]